KIVVNTLYDINKSMIENIKQIQESKTNFKEFVEIWIHEVKIPISSLVLKCHNNKDKYGEEFLSTIRRLDNYVDQVLYYVRSENTEKDFVISEVNLKDAVRNVIIKNKDDLLENNIDLKVDVNQFRISTDCKWLEYIINQIINNSIKYKKEKESIIKITTSKEDKKVILSIYDNGVGIPESDIKNVFKKSFTGANGRGKTKSTGMGLYIVYNLINKLGHSIEIDSKENEYTKVSIVFSNNDYYKM
ncbi:MAG: sensor histidine kinase, partial [bacterium]|nr:sensor histidine kinase [bacterium]